MIATRAALLYGPGEEYKIDTVELDEPGPGEVLVEIRACGLCHSDEHVRSGDLKLQAAEDKDHGLNSGMEFLPAN